jgi:hypothetical protein
MPAVPGWLAVGSKGPRTTKSSPSSGGACQVGSAVTRGGDASEIRAPFDLPELLRREVQAPGADRTGEFLVVVDQHHHLRMPGRQRHDLARKSVPLRWRQRFVAHLEQAQSVRQRVLQPRQFGRHAVLLGIAQCV